MARTRELYDRCLLECPPEHADNIYLTYAKWEEQYGLTKRALSVYEHMCTSSSDDVKKSRPINCTLPKHVNTWE